MEIISRLGRRSAVAACIVLSACAVGPSGASAGIPLHDQAYGAFLAARYAVSRQDSAAAAQYYALGLRADPGNPGMVSEGFLAALLAGSPEARTLAAQLPGNQLATMLQGNQAALDGDFAKAGQVFATLPQDDLAGLVKPLLRAWASFGQGNAQVALSLLTPNFNNGPFSSVYILNAALIADAAHDDKDAAQFYGDVLSSAPDLRLAQILASWDARRGERGLAQAQFDTLAATHPNLRIAIPALRARMDQPVIHTATQGMAEAYLTLAGALNQPSQRFLRMTLLRFALQLRPDLTPARLMLAGAQAGGDTPQATPTQVQMHNALDTLAPVTPRDPLYAPVAVQEANLLATLNRPAEAIALLDKVIALVPPDAGVFADAGDILRNAGQNSDAIRYYDKAIAIFGANPPAVAWALYFDRGICEDALNNWAAAEPDLLRALALSPNQPYVLNYLGYSWAVRGEKLDQAKAMLQQAVGLDPNDGAIIDSLGFVTLRQGDTATALDLLIQAVELDPNNAEVNAHLGDAFWQAGQKLQADYQWHRALSLQPDAKLKAQIASELQGNFPAQP
ncbi:MAG TPA: tetratricopeptide repeat protein [Acidocella sp.]|nr:tetratricopeptide repeat protein [Acidocella sp.]